jgi:hypothetical protein
MMPGNAEIYPSLVEVYQAKKGYDQMIEASTQGLFFTQGAVSLYYYRAKGYYHLGKYRTAQEDLITYQKKAGRYNPFKKQASALLDKIKTAYAFEQAEQGRSVTMSRPQNNNQRTLEEELFQEQPRKSIRKKTKSNDFFGDALDDL